MQTIWNSLKNVCCIRRSMLWKKKELYISAKQEFATTNMIRKDSSWSEKKNWLFGKEKVPGEVFSKEGDAACLMWQERTHDDWFPCKRFNSKCMTYCQLLLQKSPYLMNDPCCFEKNLFCSYLISINVFFEIWSHYHPVNLLPGVLTVRHWHWLQYTKKLRILWISNMTSWHERLKQLSSPKFKIV